MGQHKLERCALKVAVTPYGKRGGGQSGVVIGRRSVRYVLNAT